MAVKGKAVRKNHNPVQSYLPLIKNFFIMDDCQSHILKSTKGIAMEIGTNIDVNERKYRRQEP